MTERPNGRDVVDYLEERRKADEARQRVNARMRNLAIGSVVAIFLLYLVLSELGVVSY